MLAKFSGLNPKEKEKETFCVHPLRKAGSVKLGSFLSQSCNDG